MSLLAIIIIIFIIISFVIILWIIISSNNRPITGNSCQSNANCSAGTVCDGTTRTCLVPIGGICNNVNTCVTNTSCVNGRCVVNNTGNTTISTGSSVSPPVPSTNKIALPNPVQSLSVPSVPSLPPPTQRIFEKPIITPIQPIIYQDNIDDNTYELKTPYVKNDNKMLSKSGMQQGTVIDVANYSSQMIFLLDSGDIIRQDDQRKKYRIGNSVFLNRLEVFSGQLYGVSHGKLYRLDKNTFENLYWTWDICNWAIDDIIHTSVSTDLNYLWLQTSERGYIYNRRCELIHDQVNTKVKPGTKRNYGNSLYQYLEYDFSNNLTTTYNQDRVYTYENVAMGVYDNYGKIIVLNKDETIRYSNIRMINWLPYYIGY